MDVLYKQAAPTFGPEPQMPPQSLHRDICAKIKVMAMQACHRAQHVITKNFEVPICE